MAKKRKSSRGSLALVAVLCLIIFIGYSNNETGGGADDVATSSISPSASAPASTPSPSTPAPVSVPECEKYEKALNRNGMISITDTAYPQSCTESQHSRYRVIDGVFVRKRSKIEDTYSLYFVGNKLVKSQVGSFESYHDVGAWSLSSYTDELTGKPVYVARNQAAKAASKWGTPVTLYVRCKENSTEVFIEWGEYLGDDSHDVYDDWKWVSDRLDEGVVKKRKWGVSTDKKALFYRPSSSAYQFAASFAGVKRYVASTTPYNENTRTAVFDMSGAEAALAPVREACNW